MLPGIISLSHFPTSSRRSCSAWVLRMHTRIIYKGFRVQYAPRMSYALQKFTKLLLVFILVATPMRASWAVGETVGEYMNPHDMSTQLQVNEPENSWCCCVSNDCFMQSCDQCDSFTPVVLALKIQFVRSRHRIASTPYLKEFDNRQLRPPLQPPRA